MVVTAPRMHLTPSLLSGPDPVEGSSPSETCAARASLGRSAVSSNGPVSFAEDNPYLKGALGEAAVAAAKTNTFLGERYRRIVKRRGKLKALVAVARSILRIIWQLLSDPTARFFDLGPDYHANRVATQRNVRNHIAQLTAMGFHVTLEPAA